MSENLMGFFTHTVVEFLLVLSIYYYWPDMWRSVSH